MPEVRLYPSSYQLGDHPEQLIRLVRGARRGWVVVNALDGLDEDRRNVDTSRQIDMPFPATPARALRIEVVISAAVFLFLGWGGGCATTDGRRRPPGTQQPTRQRRQRTA